MTWHGRPQYRQSFFVQEEPKGPWHVESDDNCEIMMCGVFISTESPYVKIQHSWGPIKCPDCWMLFERQRRTLFK